MWLEIAVLAREAAASGAGSVDAALPLGLRLRRMISGTKPLRIRKRVGAAFGKVDDVIELEVLPATTNSARAWNGTACLSAELAAS